MNKSKASTYIWGIIFFVNGNLCSKIEMTLITLKKNSFLGLVFCCLRKRLKHLPNQKTDMVQCKWICAKYENGWINVVINHIFTQVRVHTVHVSPRGFSQNPKAQSVSALNMFRFRYFIFEYLQFRYFTSTQIHNSHWQSRSRMY